MTVWVVAGPAGSGKTTLGRALAGQLGAVLLDLDTVTNPLLDALGDQIAPAGHWNDPRLRPTVPPALRRPARGGVRPGGRASRDGRAIHRGASRRTRVVEAAGRGRPGRTARGLARRAGAAARGETRGEDRDRFPPVPAQVPRVPHERVEASAPTGDQLAALLL